ncbi:hypothetical protein ES705_37410 [subsurface metagenome]
MPNYRKEYPSRERKKAYEKDIQITKKGWGEGERKADIPTFKLLEAGESTEVFPSPLMFPP